MAAADVYVDRLLADRPVETANERFKRRYGYLLPIGIIAATAIHFALLRYFPALTAADVSFGTSELVALELPPEVQVPPPPELIARPAVPVVAAGHIEEDITIAPTTFEANPVEMLPPPPAMPTRTRLGEHPVFTPYTVPPRVRDPVAASKIVRSKYPDLLQKAGIGGTVVVWAFIDSTGVVRNCEIHTSCGVPQLDQAALEAVREISFVPALNYDRHVYVWVSIPISFVVKSGVR